MKSSLREDHLYELTVTYIEPLDEFAGKRVHLSVERPPLIAINNEGALVVRVLLVMCLTINVSQSVLVATRNVISSLD